MSAKNRAAFGIYADQVTACEAVDELRRVGFRTTDTSVLLPENFGSKDMGHEKHTKAFRAAGAGAALGAFAGGLFGWLAAIGSLGYIAWLAPYTGVQPIGTVMSGIGAGSLLGWIIGALFGGAIPEYEAKRYIGRVRNGGILVSVHCDNKDWAGRAKDVLRQTGAKGIGVRTEARADFGASEKPSPRTRMTGIMTHTIPAMRPVDTKPIEPDPNDKIPAADMARATRDR